MKKIIAGFTTFSLWMSCSGIANAQIITEFKHQDYSYFRQVLKSRNYTDYWYKIPANTLGVFTLKNNSRRSNFDIFVSDKNSKMLGQGLSPGVQTELVVTPIYGRDRYAYIRIINRGSQASQYQLYANYVSPFNKFAIELAKTVITCNPNTKNDDSNFSRVMTTLSGIIQGSSFANLTLDLIINEFTNSMRKQFGYGCTGDFMVNWGVSMVRGIYRNYF